jgi:hypothetical protein
MIASLSEFDSPRLSLHSGNESKKRSMIKELREDYQNCFNNSALSSTAKRFSPTTLQSNVTGFVRWRIQFNLRGGETFTFGRFLITIIKSLHSPGGLYYGRYHRGVYHEERTHKVIYARVSVGTI